MTKRLTLWPMVLGMSLLACGTFTVDLLTPSPTTDPVAEIVEETLTAIETERVPTNDPNPSAQSMDWLNDVNEQDAALPSYLAGLFYQPPEIDPPLYLVNQNGIPVGIAPADYGGYAASLSPTTVEMVYSNTESGEDIVIFDPSTGESRHLTNTPDIIERSAQWWPANPGKIIFNFFPQEEFGPWPGYLGAYDLQTDEYLILDDQSGPRSYFSLSPDGRTIAYDNGGIPMLYDWENGSSPLDQPTFGISFESYESPAWSPDGKKIAYWVTTGYNPDTDEVPATVVILDLENHSTVIYPEYSFFGNRVAPELSWSPEGNWLAAVNQGAAEGIRFSSALWVMRADGNKDHLLGFASSPVWSPDGHYLIYTQWPDPGTDQGSFQEDAHITVVETGVWQPTEIVELLGSDIKGWIELP